MIFLCCGCNSVDSKKENTLISISAEKVYSMIGNDSIYIIDVRQPDEYNGGHIKNAINIPVSTISEEIKNKISVDSTIIVYCANGNRSQMASKMFLEMGYSTVYDMGGINNWNYEIVVED